MLLFIIQLIALVIVVAIAFWLIDHISFPSMPAILPSILKLAVVLIGLYVLYGLAVTLFHAPLLR